LQEFIAKFTPYLVRLSVRTAQLVAQNSSHIPAIKVVMPGASSPCSLCRISWGLPLTSSYFEILSVLPDAPNGPSS